MSDWFDIKTGVSQGDIRSSLLLGLAIDFVMKTTVDAQNTGLTLISRRSSRYPQINLSDLDYADDIVLFEENELSMTRTTEATRQSANKLGLMMSHKKTEILPVGQHNIPIPNVPLGDEDDIRVVGHFKYTYNH